MSDSPPIPLTQRNGVVCRHCNSTVDLTGKSVRRYPKRKNPRTIGGVTWVLKGFGANFDRYVDCPFCGKETAYDIPDVRPIAPLSEIEQRVKIAEAERDKALAEKQKAETILRALAPELHERLKEEEKTTNGNQPKEKAKEPDRQPQGGVYG